MYQEGEENTTGQPEGPNQILTHRVTAGLSPYSTISKKHLSLLRCPSDSTPHSFSFQENSNFTKFSRKSYVRFGPIAHPPCTPISIPRPFQLSFPYPRLLALPRWRDLHPIISTCAQHSGSCSRQQQLRRKGQLDISRGRTAKAQTHRKAQHEHQARCQVMRWPCPFQ